jgi:hypothetical protein
MDRREMRYPWHPWHGRQVWIRRFSARHGLPVFQCTLDPDSRMRLLEIPQWMFDASAVCLIRLAASAVVSCEALYELKDLIAPHDATDTAKVLEGQHQSLSHTGGSDAKRSELTPSSPVAAVSATDLSASLGEPSARDSSSDRRTPRAMVTSARHRQRTGSKSGDGR